MARNLSPIEDCCQEHCCIIVAISEHSVICGRLTVRRELDESRTGCSDNAKGRCAVAGVTSDTALGAGNAWYANAILNESRPSTTLSANGAFLASNLTSSNKVI